MFEVILQKSAERDLKKLDSSIQKRIIDKLFELKENPLLGIPLTGHLSGLRKLRIGDYRAIYQIRNQELIILVVKIGHRKNVYE